MTKLLFYVAGGAVAFAMLAVVIGAFTRYSQQELRHEVESASHTVLTEARADNTVIEAEGDLTQTELLTRNALLDRRVKDAEETIAKLESEKVLCFVPAEAVTAINAAR